MPKVYLWFRAWLTAHRHAYLHYTLFPFPTSEELSFGDQRDELYFKAIQYSNGNTFSGLGDWFRWPITQKAFRRYIFGEIDTVLRDTLSSGTKYLVVDNEPDHMWRSW